MVPWRASDDGVVTRDVLDWYARFAEGRPGVLVVEATGIREVPSGPLLRIGDDRFVPGLRELVEVVRARSRGRTRLFIQVLDFLTVRRRPEPARFFDRHLELTDALRAKLALWLDDRRWREADEPEVREYLKSADRPTLETVLTDRELEALDYGYPETVWGTRPGPGSAPSRACSPASSPRPRAARARRVSTGSSCTPRTPTRWPPSSPGSTRAPTPTGARSPSACACRSRSWPRCGRASAATGSSASATWATRSWRAAARSRTRCGSACASPRPGRTTLRAPRAGASRTPGRPRAGG